MPLTKKQELLQSLLNHNAFSIQTPESDFWAGFIAADGSISNIRHQVGMSIKYSDIDFIKKFKIWCNSFHKINISQKNLYNKVFKQCQLTYTSKKQIEDLNKYYNIISRKSIILLPPNRKSLEFISGYWMGDGGISFDDKRNRWRVYFAGTSRIIHWIKEVFNILKGVYIEKHNNIFILEYSYNAAKIAANIIFNNSLFYLERKYSLYQKLVKGY